MGADRLVEHRSCGSGAPSWARAPTRALDDRERSVERCCRAAASARVWASGNRGKRSALTVSSGGDVSSSDEVTRLPPYPPGGFVAESPQVCVAALPARLIRRTSCREDSGAAASASRGTAWSARSPARLCPAGSVRADTHTPHRHPVSMGSHVQRCDRPGCSVLPGSRPALSDSTIARPPYEISSGTRSGAESVPADNTAAPAARAGIPHTGERSSLAAVDASPDDARNEESSGCVDRCDQRLRRGPDGQGDDARGHRHPERWRLGGTPDRRGVRQLHRGRGCPLLSPPGVSGARTRS